MELLSNGNELANPMYTSTATTTSFIHTNRSIHPSISGQQTHFSPTHGESSKTESMYNLLGKEEDGYEDAVYSMLGETETGKGGETETGKGRGGGGGRGKKKETERFYHILEKPEESENVYNFLGKEEDEVDEAVYNVVKKEDQEIYSMLSHSNKGGTPQSFTTVMDSDYAKFGKQH